MCQRNPGEMVFGLVLYNPGFVGQYPGVGVKLVRAVKEKEYYEGDGV